MKKSIIVTGAASLAVAATPVVGVFAATGTTVTDTVQVTINEACSITSTNASNTYSKTMTNSQLLSSDDNDGFGSTQMSISCNNAGGWHLTAVGSGADSKDKTAMNATGSGTDIATGTATSGDTSNWAMKVTGGTAIESFLSYRSVPSSAIDAAKSTVSTSGSVVNTGYRVWISATQQADTYTGQVTYTLASPAT